MFCKSVKEEKFKCIFLCVPNYMQRQSCLMTRLSSLQYRFKLMLMRWILYESKFFNAKDCFLGGKKIILTSPRMMKNSNLLFISFSMKTGKSPGNDGLSADFYMHFWKVIQHPLCTKNTSVKERLQLQWSKASYLLFPNPIKTRYYNWCPVTLLTIDYKILAYVNRLRKVV